MTILQYEGLATFILSIVAFIVIMRTYTKYYNMVSIVFFSGLLVLLTGFFGLFTFCGCDFDVVMYALRGAVLTCIIFIGFTYRK